MTAPYPHSRPHSGFRPRWRAGVPSTRKASPALPQRELGAKLQKARPLSERARIETLLKTQEKSVRQAFALFLADTRSPRMLREVRALLQAGRVEEVLQLIDSHVIRLSNVFARVFNTAGDDEVESLARRAGMRSSRVAIGFDPTNTRAAELMRRNKLSFVQQFTRKQREATRAALVASMRSGSGPVAAARVFRDSIGLTYSQMGSIARYGQLLEQGSSEALSRELRDRRFDSTVRSAFANGEPLARAQIKQMVDRYRDHFLQYRAETIARTETMRILNESRQEALFQVTEQAGLDPNQVVRTWRSTNDARTRDSHRAMDGQVRGLSEPFESPSGALLMYPGDPSAPLDELINCRCVLTVEIK